MEELNRLEFLTVMKSLLILLKSSKLEEAIELIEELVAEAKK